ncbi:MAG: carbohydrate ABC transporter permease [Chloroflexota bacterium]
MTTATTTLSEAQTKPSLRIRSAMGGLKTTLIYAVMGLLSLFFLFPLVWMIGTSLKTITEITPPQFNLLPVVPQFQNYAKLLSQEAFYQAYTNSIFIATIVLLGTVFSISLVAYAFSRLEWKGRGIVFALMMGTLLLPSQATLVPQYALFFNLGWLQTFNPITLPGFFGGGAALIFLLRQFMLTLPKELDEAAVMDGATPLEIWWYIIMPLSRPAIATVTVFLFVGQWNNLLLPSIYLQRSQLFPMPLFIVFKNNSNVTPVPWQDIMAASVLFVIPLLVVFILTQRYFVQSIAMTGSKG